MKKSDKIPKWEPTLSDEAVEFTQAEIMLKLISTMGFLCNWTKQKKCTEKSQARNFLHDCQHAI
ncbi:MAG: hypothetical protein ACTSRH_15730 [Promethearchaeota archaeon]